MILHCDCKVKKEFDFFLFGMNDNIIMPDSFDKSAENQNYPEQCNKFEYLAKSTIDGFSVEEFNLDNVYKDEDSFRSYFPKNHFVSQKCPFLHKKDTSNVLAPFFNLNSTTPPNIVILLVEGLARENSGKYSTFASATPFLDSLAEHSLTWLNCLSVSQKTFGVMPAVFRPLIAGEHTGNRDFDNP